MRSVLFAMGRAGEKITVAEVRRRANVSHAFMYQPGMRELVDEARRDRIGVAGDYEDGAAGNAPADAQACLMRLENIGIEVARLFTEEHKLDARFGEIHARLSVLLDEGQGLLAECLRLLLKELDR